MSEEIKSYLSYERFSTKQSYWCVASMLSEMSMLVYLFKINAPDDWTLTQYSWSLVSEAEG